MWDKDDPKTKWLHIALKVIAAIMIFKVGVMVGEFRIIKKLIVDGPKHHKMLFRSGEGGPSGGARYFHRRVMPTMGDKDKMMMWKAESVPQTAPAVPTTPVQTP